ncbi:MAG TPA: hypothetical protein VMG10_07360 [Gemmataceae bacterium]|nr:hypothetical protein [Gemmataceae bacterium]
MDRTMEMPANGLRSYAVIASMKKVKGAAWLGRINGEGRQTLWEWDGGKLSTAPADFVLPRYDAELDALLVARYKTEYKGVENDTKWVEAILRRINQLGGELLS